MARLAVVDGVLLLTRAEKRRFHERNEQGRIQFRWEPTGRRIAWRPDLWWEGVRRSAEAELPEDTSLYYLRHAKMHQLLLRGVPAFIIAKMLDTSVAIIEDFYAQYIGHRSEAVEAFRAAL